MRVERLEWAGAERSAEAVRQKVAQVAPRPDVGEIEREVLAGGDEALLRLTARFDATERAPEQVRVPAAELVDAQERLDPAVWAALELAADNVRAVAEAQLAEGPRVVRLPQGQTVTVREVPVGAAGIYAPGGRAAYPSTVLMCAIPAAVAGVARIALVSPPGPDGRLPDAVLAAAALCGLEEVHAVGGAQAIFALAHGTESIAPVDVIAGPGNAWVQEAKRAVAGGLVGIDSYAGPSELMVVLDSGVDPRAAALDLCAQAEHGSGGLLVAASPNPSALEGVATEAEALAGERPGIDPGALLSLVAVPDTGAAIALANALAPEHLELLDPASAALAEEIATAGCVFVGPAGATAFGDYVAGSNHVLPTGGAGRFAGPLGPGTFRRRISQVEITAEAARELAPQVDALARAEGLPIHGESAMIRR